jgi:peptidoglycan-associated lipoprotein
LSTLKAVKLLLLLLVTAIAFTGCRGCFKDGSFFGGNGVNPLSASGIESSVLPEPIRGQTPHETPNLKRIYFTFDSAELLVPAMEELRANAEWLRSCPGMHVQIEGHCDERGTIDYNYALGQQRAEAARNYLIHLGVEPERLHTISYGKDRPDDPSQNETAWARNRRVQFLVYGG